MKIICNRSELLNSINGVGRAVSGKSSIPSIEGILFQCDDTKLKLTAYDLQIGIITYTSAEIYEPGEIILNISKTGEVSVNAQVLSLAELTKRLTRISKLYPGQPVVLRADRATPYESLVGIIDACRNADVWNFSLATKDEEN